jgi:hypothetical protein
MSLSDEATEKNLLIQLADRDLISQETLLQRFKEIPQIEKIRIQREVEDRNNNVIPNKASPYHNPQHENDLEKIGLQTGKLLPKDVGLKSSVPTDILLQPKGSPFGGGGSPSSPKVPNPNGRPPLSKDSGPRKQRVANPKSKPGVAELLVWTEAAWDNISEVLNDAFLNCNNKKNLRQLTKAEASDLEQLKIDVLTNLPILEDVTASAIHSILSSKKTTPQEFKNLLQARSVSIDNMTIDNYRRNIIGLFIEENTLV